MTKLVFVGRPFGVGGLACAAALPVVLFLFLWASGSTYGRTNLAVSKFRIVPERIQSQPRVIRTRFVAVCGHLLVYFVVWISPLARPT